ARRQLDVGDDRQLGQGGDVGGAAPLDGEDRDRDAAVDGPGQGGHHRLGGGHRGRQVDAVGGVLADDGQGGDPVAGGRAARRRRGAGHDPDRGRPPALHRGPERELLAGAVAAAILAPHGGRIAVVERAGRHELAGVGGAGGGGGAGRPVPAGAERRARGRLHHRHRVRKPDEWAGGAEAAAGIVPALAEQLDRRAVAAVEVAAPLPAHQPRRPGLEPDLVLVVVAGRADRAAPQLAQGATLPAQGHALPRPAQLGQGDDVRPAGAGDGQAVRGQRPGAGEGHEGAAAAAALDHELAGGLDADGVGLAVAIDVGGLGGGRAGERGYFVQPTVLVDARQDMRVVQEEIFGPVVVALPFDDVDEAVRLANDTAYGLGASIWSNDLARVHRTIPRIKAGTVWVNCHSMLDASLPFGGYKQSGIGREMGRAAIDLFTETKSVMMAV
ncbi:MAG: aldehyde dehydrogenase family protein, partial [Kofleriaceae bacterium]|nr:aldehyde dehydrogenase family protein [Kofleriaceae bacterium]